MSKTLGRLAELTRPTGQEELLDVTYPTPRWALSLRHSLIAASVVAIGVLGWIFFQGSQTPAPEPVTSFDLPAASPVAVAEDEKLVVSIVGEVSQPGLATLAPGARVDDALEIATPLPEADLVALNLAQRLTDGQQLMVPGPGGGAGAAGQAEAAQPGSAGETSGAGGAVSLNSATQAELVTLSGVGAATADAIIAHREATGGFKTLEDVLDVKGIGPSKFEAIRGDIVL